MGWTESFGLVADIVGILGAIFALLAWMQTLVLRGRMQAEKNRLNKKIRVVLQHGARSIDLPIELRRSEATRAEILGRIGMIPMNEKGKRFSLAYLNRPEFLRQVNQIATSDEIALLTIPCDAEEYQQFDLTTSESRV